MESLKVEMEELEQKMYDMQKYQVGDAVFVVRYDGEVIDTKVTSLEYRGRSGGIVTCLKDSYMRRDQYGLFSSKFQAELSIARETVADHTKNIDYSNVSIARHKLVIAEEHAKYSKACDLLDGVDKLRL